MKTQQTDPVTPEVSQLQTDSVAALGGAAADLAGVAGLWVQHGLRVGRLYLETGAKSLERAAKALGELSRSLEQRGHAGEER